jgi:predicted transposase YbfD/YdcC
LKKETFSGKFGVPAPNQKPKKVKMASNTNGIPFACGSLYEHLQKIEDSRKKRGIRYSVASVLLFIILAKLCGQNTPFAIADWVQNHQAVLCEALALPYKRMPHHSTYRRFMVLFGIRLEAELGAFLQSMAATLSYEVIAFDGKTLRGTLTPEDPFGLHLLTAYLPEIGIALKQLPVEKEKENKIVVAPQLLEGLDLQGKIVVGDAMQTQRNISRQILDDRGHYAWIAKDNQKHVRQAIELLFLPEVSKPGMGCPPMDFRSATTTDKQHGRLEVRTITLSSLLNDYLDWPGLSQVFKIERCFTHTRTGKVHQEVHYGLTSLSAALATPQKMLEVLRREWGIENSLHYRRDETFQEDRTRMENKTAARCLAMIHNAVIAILKQQGISIHARARRTFDAYPFRALSILLGL